MNLKFILNFNFSKIFYLWQRKWEILWNSYILYYLKHFTKNRQPTLPTFKKLIMMMILFNDVKFNSNISSKILERCLIYYNILVKIWSYHTLFPYLPSYCFHVSPHKLLDSFPLIIIITYIFLHIHICICMHTYICIYVQYTFQHAEFI